MTTRGRGRTDSVRVVIDTNVLVSALLVPGGVPDQCVQLAIARRFRWLVDQRIIAEYREVLRRREFGFAAEGVARILDVIEQDCDRVIAAPLPLRLPDESDVPFLEVAAAGGADAIVTGNVRHFAIAGGRLAVPIVSPRRFLDLLR